MSISNIYTKSGHMSPVTDKQYTTEKIGKISNGKVQNGSLSL